jgi:arsenite-transporting ATPase
MAGYLPPGNLKILEINAHESLAAFRKEHNEKFRKIASRGTFLDAEDIEQFLELSLPGLDELMAFLEITRLLESHKYSHIIIDTAPTGHTLRLLAMPEMLMNWLQTLDTLLEKNRYMKKLFIGHYQRDELDEFLLTLTGSVQKMKALLRDPNRCRFVPVMIAEELSSNETLGLLNELEHREIPLADVVVNKLHPESECPVCSDMQERQLKVLGKFCQSSADYALWGVPIFPEEIQGIGPLEKFWDNVVSLGNLAFEVSDLLMNTKKTAFPQSPAQTAERIAMVKTNSAVGEYNLLRQCRPIVEAPGRLPSSDKRFLFFAGKGGVGKTTLACATAIRMALSYQNKEVFLFSTDPAHSLSACLGEPIGAGPTRLLSGLTAMEIDSQAEFKTLKNLYAEELKRFLSVITPNLDLTFDREVMERILNLAPPGLDEMMALMRAIELLRKGDYDIFVFDSAPTGHLIRLLETPEIIDQWLKAFFCLFLKYKKIFRLPKISQRLVQISKDLKLLQTLIRDPSRSSLCIVTILSEMALAETRDLIDACNRMAIDASALFLNLATFDSDCPLCKTIYQRESQIGEKIHRIFPELDQTLVYRCGEPRGMDQLGALGQVLYS